MRNMLFGAVLALLIVFVYRYCDRERFGHSTQFENTTLIEQQLANVGKLIVTEGSFSEVQTFKDAKTLYFEGLTSEKRAIVIVNAKAQVAYDLSQMDVTIDTINKKIVLRNIPEPELTITPDLEYFDIENGYFNPFSAEDFNAISEQITDSLDTKIRESTIMTNAQNRLISELQKLYILSNTMGWTLEYEETPITSNADWQRIKL
ncbi:MAG: DUF4230 domain-containing protein [Gilvibacter sp.]